MLSSKTWVEKLSKITDIMTASCDVLAQPLLSVDSVWSIHPLQILLWASEETRAGEHWPLIGQIIQYWPLVSSLWNKHPQNWLIFLVPTRVVFVTKQKRWRTTEFFPSIHRLVVRHGSSILVIDITLSHKQVWLLAADTMLVSFLLLLFLCTYTYLYSSWIKEVAWYLNISQAS